MPKLWSQTIETHRHEVRDAIMETTWALAAEHGPLAVTMSQIAQETGIGRATLYKYFPNVETILRANHERHVVEHLGRLNTVGHSNKGPRERLHAVSLMYARMRHHRSRHGTVELSALVHTPDLVSGAEGEIFTLFEGLLTEAIASGDVLVKLSPSEQAVYVIHALGAAESLPSDAAVGRLVRLTLAALLS